MKDLVFISGGSAGIGLATANWFLDKGYEVVSASRRKCPTAAVISLQVDLAGGDWPDVVGKWVSTTLRTPRRMVLVHNAAAAWHDNIGDVTAQNLKSMFEVSLIAPATLNQMLLPHMGAGSAIVYVGSTLSTMAVPNSFSYITAKHALVGMMRATCQDLFGRGIHTACVCPGTTDTDMLRALHDANNLERFRAMTGVHRLITPQEIAEVIYQVASTPVLNGDVIHANYGPQQY